jgi:hypothetical protein
MAGSPACAEQCLRAGRLITFHPIPSQSALSSGSRDWLPVPHHGLI